jgi:hypothetical protein
VVYTAPGFDHVHSRSKDIERVHDACASHPTEVPTVEISILTDVIYSLPIFLIINGINTISSSFDASHLP